MAKDETKKEGSKHPWRENAEALSMAIAVALLFKYFILEISKIPSGSMQPTLIGDETTQVFDRVLVDKLSMRFRDPRRWEIVVFKHPLERSRIMVKRLVGLPEEELRIAKGDVWTRPDESSEWRVERRPRQVQEEMWKLLQPANPKRPDWTLVSGGEQWRVTEDEARVLGEGKIRFRESEGPVRDDYLDGYPEALRGVPTRGRGTHAVGDLRLEGKVEAEADLKAVTVELTEGSRTYRFSIPGPAGEDEAPTIHVRDPRSPTNGESETTAEPYRLPAGATVRFAAENLDDRLALEVDGEVVASVEVEAADDQEAFLTLGASGGQGELRDLQVYRDVYYLADPNPASSLPSKEWQIGPGKYLMLGDNTQDSADSRDWEFKRMLHAGDSGEATPRGNFRGDPNGLPLPDSNPIRIQDAQGEPLWRFLDEWGERHWLPRKEYTPGFSYEAPLVPRHLIQGRALAVFWPLKPWRGLWRLTWLH